MTVTMSNFKYWVPAALYMAVIFWLSSRPSPEALKLIPIIAHLKLVHIIEYGLLYALVYYAFEMTTDYSPVEIFAASLMLTVLYGLTDELHQIFIVGRTSRLADVLADGVGGLICQGAFLLKSKLG